MNKFSPRSRKFLIIPLLGIFAFGISVAQADRPPSRKPTAVEFKMLPPYCYAKMGTSRDDPIRAKWQQRLGRENFVHVHHYCVGLNELRRSRFESDEKRKKFFLRRSIANFDYVLQRWAPSFPLTLEASRHRETAQNAMAFL